MDETRRKTSENFDEQSLDHSQEAGDGKRMRCLRNTMNKTLKAFISRLSLVRPINNASTAVLKNLNEEVKKQLETNIKVEIEAIYEEVNIASLLNGLDELVEGPLVDTSLVVGTTPTPQSEKTRWRPSGDVEADTRVFAAMLKKEQLQVLEKTLADLEAQNKLLQDQEQKREKRLLRSRDKLVNLLANTEQTVEQERSTLDQQLTKLQSLDR